MSRLSSELAAILPAGMRIPDEFIRLYEWIEERGLLYGPAPAERELMRDPPPTVGALGETRIDDDDTVHGGTSVEFRAQDPDLLKYWFGRDDASIRERLCDFVQTGGEGSSAAFWLDDDGVQRIVHMGSGSGSTLTCVLADEPIDFLRLLAIGYDEICFADFSEPPNREGEPLVHPNVEYQDWLRTEFGVTIPQRGSEIVAHPAEMHDSHSEDPFWQWVQTMT